MVWNPGFISVNGMGVAEWLFFLAPSDELSGHFSTCQGLFSWSGDVAVDGSVNCFLPLRSACFVYI